MHRSAPHTCSQHQSKPEEPVFPALPRLSRRGSTHTTVARGTALWESLVGKPRGKDTYPSIHAKGSVTLRLQIVRKELVHDPTGDENDSPGVTPEVPQDTRQHCRGILRCWPRIHTSLRPQHRWERNHERSPNNSQGDWPFLRPPERVPEVPVVSREHLPQLEKIQEVLPSRRDEAHFR